MFVLIYLSINIGLISIGLYQSWRKDFWNVVISILALIAMISIYVLIRRSGGRFLQTMDWISVMFLCIGLVHLGDKAIKQFITKGFSSDFIPEPSGQKVFQTQPGGWIIFILIFILGASPVIVELALPNGYPDSIKDIRIKQLLGEGNPEITQQEKYLLKEFLDQGGEVLYGQALYPSYFPPDATLMTSNQTLFSSSTAFTIAGSELNFVVLPQGESPKWFPQGTETLVIGCRESSIAPDLGFPCLGCLNGEFEAFAVVVYDSEDQPVHKYWRDGNEFKSILCPLD